MPDSPSEVVYGGEVLHIDFNPESMADLEAALAEFIELDEGEELHVSPRGDGALVVQKLKKRG